MLLEELAAHFQLKTQEAIDRIQKLVQEGTLTGVYNCIYSIERGTCVV